MGYNTSYVEYPTSARKKSIGLAFGEAPVAVYPASVVDSVVVRPDIQPGESLRILTPDSALLAFTAARACQRS